MVNSIQNTLADGFDPDALMKLDLDTQERLQSLSEPLYAGPNPNTAFPAFSPFIPKEFNTSDLLFRQKNNISISDLMNSDDPEKIKLGWDYITKEGLNSDALKYGLHDYVYQTNPTIEKLKDKGYGYDITRSATQNEDEAYKQEKDSHWWITNAAGAAVKGIARLPGQVLIKAASIGAKAAAIFDHIVYENDTQDLLTAMADNVFVRSIQDVDESYKANFLNSLQSSDYSKAGFFKKMGYSQFWTDEAVDFTSYLLASRGLGGFVTKALSGIGRGAAAGTIGRTVGGALRTNVPGKVGNVLKFVTGSSNVAGIAAYAANITNEATDESVNQYKKIKEDLAGQMNPDTGEAYTPEEIQSRASGAAALTFKGNLAILALSGGLENRWIQRAIGKEALEKGLKDITIDNSLKAIEKQFSNKLLNRIAQNGMGKRVLFYGPEVVEGLLKEGYWEENAQTAMTRLADIKFGKGSYDRITDDGTYEESTILSGNSFKDFFRQLGKQTRDASTWLGGAGDNEVSTAIGIGGLIAAGGTAASNKVALKQMYDKQTDAYKFRVFKSERRAEEDEKLRRIDEINNARENFLSFNDVFNEDGTIDKEKLMAKSQKVADLETRLDAIEDVTNPVIKKDLQERLFSEFVLAHFNNGTFDQFKTQFGNRTEEELAALGFSDELIGNPEEFVALGNKLEEQFKAIKRMSFGNSANLRAEQFQHFDSMLKSRLYQLQANSIINQNTVDRMNVHMNDTYGDVFRSFLQHDSFQTTLLELEDQVDSDGSLSTQKEIIKEQLKDLEDEISIQMKNLQEENSRESEEKFVNDLHQFENVNEYQKTLNEEIKKYLSDTNKSVEIFRNEYKETISEEEEEVELPPVVEEVREETTELPTEETTDETGTETETTTEESTSTETPEQAQERRAARVKELARNRIISKINEAKSKEALDKYFEGLTTDQQSEHNELYNSKSQEFAGPVDADIVTQEEGVLERFEDSDVPYATILKTSSRDTNDKEGSNFEEIVIESDYNTFRNRFLSATKIKTDLEDKGYYFVLEMDDFTNGNIGNLSKEAFDDYLAKNPEGGVAIVLKNPRGESVKVSDIFPGEFESIQDKNVQFYVDQERKLPVSDRRSRWNEMATIRFLRQKVPVDVSIAQFTIEANQLKSAIAIARKGGTVRLRAESIKLPQILAKDGATLDYRTLENVKDVFIDTNTRQARVILDNDIELLAYPKGIASAPVLFEEVKRVMSTQYETREEAVDVRRDFLHVVFRNTVDRYFEIQENNGKFTLVPIIIENKVKTVDAGVLAGTRPINISRKGFAGQMQIQGNNITKEEYLNLIKGSLETAQKIIYNPDGTQYMGATSSYLNYTFDDPKIVDILEEKRKRTESIVKEIKKLFKARKLKTVASLYVDNSGKFLRRVTSLKKSPDIIFGTEDANRGTLVDDLFREFLVSDISKEEFKENFIKLRNKMSATLPLPNMTEGFISDLYDSFKKFKEHNPNLTYIADISTLYGNIQGEEFAGTIDILAIDNRNNDLFIIDLKSANRSRTESYKDDESYYSVGDRLQLNFYAELVKQMTGREVKGLFTFPLKLTGDGTSLTGIETEENILLPVKRVDVASLVQITPEDPESKYIYKFKGDVEINKTIIPKSKYYAIYSTIDNIIKDYLIATQKYKDNPTVYKEPRTSVLNELVFRGVAFKEKEDRDAVKAYVDTLLTAQNLYDINPDFESIHRAPNPDFKAEEVKAPEVEVVDPRDEKYLGKPISALLGDKMVFVTYKGEKTSIRLVKSSGYRIVEIGGSAVGNTVNKRVSPKETITFNNATEALEFVINLIESEKNSNDPIADIERRRQEELDNQAGSIRVKTEIVEGINDNGEPTRILIHTNKDGSRTVQFEGKFNGEKDWTRIGTEKVNADIPLEARGFANRTYNIQKPRVVETIENPESLPANKINTKYDAEIAALNTPTILGEDLVREMLSNSGRSITEMTVEEQILVNAVPMEIKVRIQKELEQPTIVPNPIEEKKKFTPRKIGKKEGLGNAKFSIDGNTVIFNEKTGRITVNGSERSMTRQVISEIFENYNDKEGAVKIVRQIIRTKSGNMEVYLKRYPDTDKNVKLQNSYIFDSENRFVGDMRDLNETGGILIKPEEFLDNGETLLDIQEAQALNC